MQYKEIIKQIACNEGVSEKEIEKEMLFALKSVGLDCSVYEFLDSIKKLLKRLYIVNRIIYSLITSNKSNKILLLGVIYFAYNRSGKEKI